MNSMYIYIILLEDNCYFIHHAYKKTEEQIMQEFEIQYDFVKIHRPICVLDIIAEKDELQLDAVVKEFMYEHGYAYVRGGSYTNPKLTPIEESFIEKELNTNLREYPPYNAFTYEYLLAKYVNSEWQEELKTEYDELKTEFLKYQQEKIQLDEIEIYDRSGEKRLDLHVIYEIEELRDFCKIRGDNIEKVTKEWKDKYQKLLPKIQHVLRKYMELCDSPSPKYSNLHVPPQFFMDSFFYTYSFSPSPKRTCEEIDAFFESILYFTNWIICRIQEYTFHVQSYTYDIEWLYLRIFYVLEKRIKEHYPSL